MRCICNGTSQCLPCTNLIALQIGQAIRVAQIHGLHTAHQVEEIGESLVQRYRRLWWTLYSLDRRLSAMIGLAHSLHDHDITSPLPDASSFDEPFVLSVRLSQQIGKAVNSMIPLCSLTDTDCSSNIWCHWKTKSSPTSDRSISHPRYSRSFR